MTASSNSRLMELLDRWEEAAGRGEQVDPQQLCADAPELLDDLKKHISALKAIDGMLNNETEDTEATRPLSEAESAAIYQTWSSYSQPRLLAQGGLGVVYHATDDELHREVVLKFIHRHIAQSDEHQNMFRREAEVTSRLDHPGVVPVYGIGQSGDGRVFYSMRYVQGETLDDAIRRLHSEHEKSGSRGGLPLRNLLGRFVTICKTIAYAHNRGIIHRDIKPANIMLGRYGETLVVDWGLAIPIGRDERFRQSGEQTLMPSSDSGERTSERGAGTPAFMSPEAMSKAAPTPATDIYSLGATLYKLLTGKTPFDGQRLDELRQNVLSGIFAPPGKVKRGVSKALEAICLKAMAQNPDGRYDTALELAADIENYLADEPVTAYHEPLPRRAARWARRNRSQAQAILIGVIALAVVTVASAIWLGYLANREREARLVAEEAKQQSLRMAAKFASRTIAGQIDLRWRILEAACEESAIKNSLVEINASPDDRALWLPAQAWLNERYIELQNEHSIECNSLFVLNAQGVQIARTPISDSIGNSYAFRDYFHGQGFDLIEGEEDEIRPIQKVNLSATYTSSTSGELKVAFTVPIFSGPAAQQHVIGVCGMSIELGGFGVLETDLQSGQLVVLVDTRKDTVEGDPRRGLILQHPRRDLSQPLPDLARIDDDALAQLDASNGNLLFRDYRDPLAPGSWIASAEPVVIESRRPPIANTGWVVLVQELDGR